MPCPNFTSQ